MRDEFEKTEINAASMDKLHLWSEEGDSKFKQMDAKPMSCDKTLHLLYNTKGGDVLSPGEVGNL